MWHRTFVEIDVVTLVDQVEWKNCSALAGTESELEMGAEWHQMAICTVWG